MNKEREQELRNDIAIMNALINNWHTRADHGEVLKERVAETEALLKEPRR